MENIEHYTNASSAKEEKPEEIQEENILEQLPGERLILDSEGRVRGIEVENG